MGGGRCGRVVSGDGWCRERGGWIQEDWNHHQGLLPAILQGRNLDLRYFMFFLFLRRKRCIWEGGYEKGQEIQFHRSFALFSNVKSEAKWEEVIEVLVTKK